MWSGQNTKKVKKKTLFFFPKGAIRNFFSEQIPSTTQRKTVEAQWQWSLFRTIVTLARLFRTVVTLARRWAVGLAPRKCPTVPNKSFETTKWDPFERPHGLTFTWWGCCRLCLWHKLPSLPTPVYSVLVSVSVFMGLSTVFYSINSLDNSPLSHFVLPVLFLPYSTIYLFMKVFLSPDIILCGWLRFKHQLTD